MLCVLEDDNLVTEVSVTTDQLLEPNVPDNEVVVLLDVTVRRTTDTLSNQWMST